MNYLNSTFSKLFREYSKVFGFSEHSGGSRNELMRSIPAGNRGVYTYWLSENDYPLYIGCAGKISFNGKLGGNTIKKRIFSANTPYHFSKTEDILLYSPTTAGVPPAGYHSEVELTKIIIKIITIETAIAPAALEHVLLQGFVNEYGKLPCANQKL